MVAGLDGQDGGRRERRPGRRVRHDRRACRDVTVTKRVPGRRAIDQCLAVDRRLTVHPGADYAEPWQWLGQHELPEYVGGRPLDAAEAAGLEV
jgi:hypothetical protein